jgi:hypothetical protein
MIQIWMLGLLRCDGHHKMSDLGAAGEPVHRDGESLASAWHHQRLDSSFAGLMEKNMSKSNDSLKLGRATQVRELRDDELQEVSGGSCCAGSHFPAVKLNGRIPGATAPEGEVKF